MIKVRIRGEDYTFDGSWDGPDATYARWLDRFTQDYVDARGPGAEDPNPLLTVAQGVAKLLGGTVTDEGTPPKRTPGRVY